MSRHLIFAFNTFYFCETNASILKRSCWRKHLTRTSRAWGQTLWHQSVVSTGLFVTIQRHIHSSKKIFFFLRWASSMHTHAKHRVHAVYAHIRNAHVVQYMPTSCMPMVCTPSVQSTFFVCQKWYANCSFKTQNSFSWINSSMAIHSVGILQNINSGTLTADIETIELANYHFSSTVKLL